MYKCMDEPTHPALCLSTLVLKQENIENVPICKYSRTAEGRNTREHDTVEVSQGSSNWSLINNSFICNDFACG